MQKLIIDEEAIKLACLKLSEQPIYGSPDGKFISPGIIDVVDYNDEGKQWQPSDERSRLLVLAGEACRDLIFHAERFENKTSRNRVIKSMTVPLCSLMDQIQKLMNLLNDEESQKIRTQWPSHDRQIYKDIGKRFRKKHYKGSVRKVRNKLGAHLDQEVLVDRTIRLDLKDFLNALGDSLILMNLLINHPNAFSWIRWIGSSEKGDLHIVETFFGFPICTRWVTDVEGRVNDVGLMQLADDPRFNIQEDVISTIQVYNTLIDKTELSRSQVSKILSIPSVNLQILEHSQAKT